MNFNGTFIKLVADDATSKIKISETSQSQDISTRNLVSGIINKNINVNVRPQSGQTYPRVS